MPWALPGSGFTLLFQALALSLCQSWPAAQAAAQLRVASKCLWRGIAHNVPASREQEIMTDVHSEQCVNSRTTCRPMAAIRM
ncbi:transposase family protein [Actimicrobium sp. CCI2.3]|uniref:transposase family protein n=1 Tax=Actimicrobium sp. CCI2.3 TaxID=3048616 RepID=UPI003A599CB9